MTMKRLIHEHPQTAQAFAAQRRLYMMDMENRLRRSRVSKPASSSSAA
jgi:hypothetical protein